jgi:hypothetical protein
MKPRYCYWSVCDGSYGALMEMCVRSARAAGVFKEFHLLTDRPLEGCECYDAYQFEKSCGLFKLHYLKVGMSRLNFDYFAWIDADSLFMRNPIDLLGAMGKSPIHVPLELNLSAIGEDHQWRGVSVFELRDLFRKQGITNQVYLSGSAFWIIHHDVIDSIYELAMGFWHKGKEIGLALDVAAWVSPCRFCVLILNRTCWKIDLRFGQGTRVVHLPAEFPLDRGLGGDRWGTRKCRSSLL